MQAAIEAAIAALEAREQVRVLFAAESGSRAWGFASPDSDYDVRFIYAHDLPWYLSVSERRDVLEAMLPGDLDLSGWDLRKTLGLYARCNLALNEWLGSPIVYCERGEVAARLRSLMERFFRPTHAMFHYLNTARTTQLQHLSAPQVRLKKLYYALRPLLACRWIEHRRSQPPTAFAQLLAPDWVTGEERAHIDALQAAKRVALESERTALSDWWQHWLAHEISHAEQVAPQLAERNRGDVAELDALLRATLMPS